MRNVIKNISIAIVSVVLTLSTIEFILYLSGEVYYTYRIKNKIVKSKDRGTTVILCLGDSYTFGMGASKGYSYPEQLQKLLDQDNKRKFIVYNEGMPGNTSAKLFNHLEDKIRRFNPDILIVLIGGSDGTCIEESNYFLFKDGSLRSFSFKLQNYLSQFRVYKLFNRGLESLSVNLWRKRLAAKFASSDKLVSLKLKRSGSLITDKARIEESTKHDKLGRIYFNSHDRKANLAMEEFKKAITLYPNNISAYNSLAQVYNVVGNPEKGIDTLKKAAKIDPYNKEIFRNLWYSYYRSGEEELAQQILEKYLYLKPQDIPTYLPFLKYGLPKIDDMEAFGKLTRFNLSKVVDFAIKKKIKIILLNYANGGDEVNLIAKEVAFKKNTPFIDIVSKFEELKLQDNYKHSDYFVEDGHCNNNGYFIMANKVYNGIEEIIYK